MCVSFYVKNINEDQSTIDIQDRSLAVKLSNPGINFQFLC